MLNSRMANVAFEDANPDTVGMWAYPDGSAYSPDRQTDEFVAMVPTYAAYGLNGVTISLQGGRPALGEQVWINTAFRANGSLKDNYMSRMDRAIEALDDNGMVAIVTLFYFGQDENLSGEEAIKTAVDNTVDWILARGYENVVLEIANEVDHSEYDHAVLSKERVDELVVRARNRSGGTLLVSASLQGGRRPELDLREDVDFILVHGNGVDTPGISAMIDGIRSYSDFRASPMPIVFNEDSTNLANMNEAVSSGASWGYHDRGANNYRDGFQFVPSNWTINTSEKQAFFDRVHELTN